MKPLPLVIGTVSLLGVLAVVAWEWRHRTSPGPLHPSHAQVAELHSGAGCAACHGDGQVRMDRACLACHGAISEQLAARSGMHGALDPGAAAACGACHVEHSGAAVALVTDGSFAQAGVPDQAAYDHGHIEAFMLSGRHTQIGCEQCHTRARAAALLKDQRRFLGLSQECVSCHEDSHKGAFGPDCLSCHGQSKAFEDAPEFTHTDSFLLTEKHAGVACDRCHQTSGSTSVAVLHKSTVTVRQCAACHEDPHEGAFGADCASCHDTVQPFERASAYAHTSEFPLLGGHESLACKECHEKAGPRSVASLRLGPLPVRECSECHPSAHPEGVLAGFAAISGRPSAQVCAECHRAEHRTFRSPAATMTPQLHRATGFALDPPHHRAECTDCHKDLGRRPALDRGADLRRTFAAVYPGRPAQECAACHKDPHAGQFDPGPSGGRCLECHSALHFQPAVFDLTQHERTTFALTGAHRAVACSECHPSEPDGVVRYAGIAVACAECHRDVHEGAFDGPDRPTRTALGEGCARCHSTGTFKDVEWTPPDHGVWTGYALDGAHAKAACVQCHERSASAGPGPLGLLPAPKTCAECHTDPHAGQFRANGATDCARCHTSTTEFTVVAFDHQKDARFPLDADHVQLDCAACHRAYETAAGSVVRYRPLGLTCADCHDGRRVVGEARP